METNIYLFIGLYKILHQIS